MCTWLAHHSSFSECTYLFSISTGVIADDKINCHLAGEIGADMVSKMTNQSFSSLKFKRSERITPLAAMSRSITIESTRIPINTQTLFHRMILTKQSDTKLENCLQYELSPYPLSLFSEEGMRKEQDQSYTKNLCHYLQILI